MEWTEAVKRKYHNIYSRMVGITFTYDIDSEYIVVTDEEDDKDTFSWDDIIKWNQDTENIYLLCLLMTAL